MAFKGCVKCLQFNPSKPNKFHIKLFMVSEHLSGYISRFLVYIRKTANELVGILSRSTIDTFGTLRVNLDLAYANHSVYMIYLDTDKFVNTN